MRFLVIYLCVFFIIPLPAMAEEAVGIGDKLEKHPAAIMLLGIIVSALTALLSTRSNTNDLKEELADRRSWLDMAERYRGKSKWGKNYLQSVQGVGDWATAFYRFDPNSAWPRWGTFGRCLQIAFFYPIIALMIAWVLGGAGTLGGVEMLKTDLPFWQRLRWTVVFITGIGIFATVLWQTFDYDSWFYRKLTDVERDLTTRASLYSQVARVVIAAIRLLAPAFAVASAFAAAFAFAVAVAVAFASASAFAFASTFASTVVAAFAPAATFADPAEAEILLLLYLLLPLLNAAADMVSITATRHFLRRIVRDKRSWWFILMQVVLDLFIAAVCLAFLLVSLIITLELWAWFDVAQTFNYRLYWDQIRANPADGTWLYLMLLTTLAPTFVHVVAGVTGVLVQRGRWLRSVANDLDTWHAQYTEDSMPSVAKRNDMENRIRRVYRVGGFLVSLVIAMVFIIPFTFLVF